MKKNMILSVFAVVVSLSGAACDKGPSADADPMRAPAMSATAAATAPMAGGMAAPGASGMAMDHGGEMGHGTMGAGGAAASGTSMGHATMAAPSNSTGMAH